MYVALLTGGISAERPISLRSAEGLESFLREAGHTYDVFDIPENIDNFLQEYRKYDVILPYIHGRYGEDGVVTGLCETLGLRYAGSPATTHALCIDKFRTNCVVEKLGIRVPKSWIPGINSATTLGLPEKIMEEKVSQPTPSLIVKPNCGGSTVATNKTQTVDELLRALDEVRINTQSLSQANQKLLGGDTHFHRFFPDYTDTPLVQEYIDGDEYTVGVVGPTLHPEVLPIMQITNLRSALFDWKEKYESDGSNEIFPQNMDGGLHNELIETSKRIYTMLGCRGVARVDYRVRGKDVFFLEVNTFPGATNASFIPKMWKKTGKTMADFINLLLQE